MDNIKDDKNGKLKKKKKNTRMLTRNDKMATNNSVRVSKMYARNTKGVKLDVFFSFVV